MSDDTLRFVDETKQTQDTYSYLKPIGIRKLRKQINTKEFKKNYFVIDTRKEQPLVVHYDPNHVRTPLSAGGSNSSTSSAPPLLNTNHQHAFPNGNTNENYQLSTNLMNHQPFPNHPKTLSYHQTQPNCNNKRVQFRTQPQQFLPRNVNNMENQTMSPSYHLNSRRTLSMPEFLAHYSPPLIDCDQTSQLFMDEYMDPSMMNNDNPSPIYRKSSIDCQYGAPDHQMNDGFTFLTPHTSLSPEEQYQQDMNPTIHHQLLNKHFSMNDIGKYSTELGRVCNTINILETLQMACNAQSAMVQEETEDDCHSSITTVLRDEEQRDNNECTQTTAPQQQQQQEPIINVEENVGSEYLLEGDDELFETNIFSDYLYEE